MSPADDLARYIAGLGLGIFGNSNQNAWAVSVAREPIEPANCITFYDTGGVGADTDELDLYRPSIQVRVRSRDYMEGCNKQQQIRLALHAIAGATINGKRYVGVTNETDINHIGMSENNMFLTTINYQVIHE